MKFNLSLFKSMAAAFIFICGLTACDQSKQAKEKTDLANQILTKIDKDFTATSQKEDALSDRFGKDQGEAAPKPQQFKPEVQALMQNYGQLADQLQVAADHFKQASQLKIPQEIKGYYSLNSDAVAKRVGLMKLRQAHIQHWQELIEKGDFEAFNKKTDELNTKREALSQEAEALEKKSEAFYNAHRELFAN